MCYNCPECNNEVEFNDNRCNECKIILDWEDEGSCMKL